ncbi:hypothetical protein [Rhizobacter sp. Root1221]|uniref:hypothetical protein n=1 Tax=Rhizobacter sp. Root1221 TaxID=1736433 RepID=UPI0012F711B5|nr:hypothetical protein [Rhizobacter sp. Root1221]
MSHQPAAASGSADRTTSASNARQAHAAAPDGLRSRSQPGAQSVGPRAHLSAGKAAHLDAVRSANHADAWQVRADEQISLGLIRRVAASYAQELGVDLVVDDGLDGNPLHEAEGQLREGFACHLVADMADEHARPHAEPIVLTPRGEVILAVPSGYNWLGATRGLPYPLGDTTYQSEIIPSRILGTSEVGGPQVDRRSCAALGLAYVKELFKDDASLLKHRSLLVDLPASDQHFFLPPPQVLRYAQNRLYVEALRALVHGTKSSASANVGDKKVEVPTLRHALAKGAVLRRPDTGEQLDAAAYKAFAKAWLEDFETTMARREAMQLGNKNLYLQHVVQRLGRKDDAQQE